MILRDVRALLLLGLGALAGAVLPACASAQAPVARDTVAGRRDTVPSRVDTAGGRRNLPPAGRDTVRIPLPARADSMIRNDSIIQGVTPAPFVLPPDTIKAPLARAESPPLLEIGPPRIYDRAALFATGAFSLSDMLGRVPGLTSFATGVAGAPTVVASQGDLRRIRLYLDGLELDPMDPRGRGIAPVNDIPLSSLEDVRIERGADEVRVYARSWRVDRTVPFTRADVFTGDQNTNLYRAYFGRRYSHGEALQVAAEQYNAQPNNALPSSDGRQFMGRVGITRGPWSADAFAQRTERSRGRFVGQGGPDATRDTLPGGEMKRTTSYIRFGNGDAERGRWIQATASAHDYHLAARTANSSFTSLPSAADSANAAVDSSLFESQYLLTGGLTRGPVRASLAERVRVGRGLVSHVMSGR
ncbi:MAG: Plug domain-containing protein, partial [Gemmatimonadaceae bacterium]|nr:Plug domain-containing protein [Gemmatimonadaceae bacterium]